MDYTRENISGRFHRVNEVSIIQNLTKKQLLNSSASEIVKTH